MAVVCHSICPMPDRNSRTEWRRKLKTGRKEAHHTWLHLEVERSNICWGNFGAEQLGYFIGTLMFYRQSVYNTDANVKWTISVIWPLSWKLWMAVGGWGILCRHHNRPHSLLLLGLVAVKYTFLPVEFSFWIQPVCLGLSLLCSWHCLFVYLLGV